MTISLISGVIGLLSALAAVFLKFWPELERKRDLKISLETSDEFGRELLEGNDIGASVRMSDEIDRVRREEGGDTSI